MMTIENEAFVPSFVITSYKKVNEQASDRGNFNKSYSFAPAAAAASRRGAAPAVCQRDLRLAAWRAG